MLPDFFYPCCNGINHKHRNESCRKNGEVVILVIMESIINVVMSGGENNKKML